MSAFRKYIKCGLLALLLSTSPAFAFGRDEVADIVQQQLSEHYPEQNWLVSLDQKQLTLSGQSSAPASMSDFVFNESSGRFTGKLQQDANLLTVSGRAVPAATVPVLVRPVAAGKIISAEDLTEQKLPLNRITTGIIRNGDELVGQQARRGLAVGQPVQMRDISMPAVIKRGDIVTLELAQGALRITARGKALEDGAKGQTIRLANSQTERTIEGMVQGPGLVAVVP